MANGLDDTAVLDPSSSVGQPAGQYSGLAPYIGPYVTEMLGKGMALADKPFEAYTGPLTAGASGLQEQAFSEYAGLDPNQQTGIGSFSTGYTPGSFTGVAPRMQYRDGRPNDPINMRAVGEIPRLENITPAPIRMVGETPRVEDRRVAEGRPKRKIGRPIRPGGQDFRPPEQPMFGQIQPPQSPVGQYMNPYLQAALEPQLREARRQADISRVADATRLTRAGAFGGSRQAIMEAEGARNLGQQLADITGRGYSDAFTQAQRQFNVEQEALRRAEEARRAQFNEEERRRIAAEEADRRFGLDALDRLERAGEKQREIEQQGIAADYAQFLQEREYPYEQLQFMQSLLSGLPLGAETQTFVQPGGLQQIGGGAAGILGLLQRLA
jgi:hypothetical protein